MDWVLSVALGPDDNIVSGSEDTTVRRWNADTGQPIGVPLTGHTAAVRSVAFSPDGHRLLSAGFDKTLRLWNADTGELIAALGHTDWVLSVGYSPDGHRIVSGSNDNTLRLWNADTREPIGPPLTGHTDGVDAVAISPDERHIVSGSNDKTLRLWPGPAVWPQLLCDKLTANMSHKQWNDWVSPDIDYIEVCPGLPIPPDS